MNKKELKECPCCKGKVKLIKAQTYIEYDFIHCIECDLVFEVIGEDDSELINKFNTRK